MAVPLISSALYAGTGQPSPRASDPFDKASWAVVRS